MHLHMVGSSKLYCNAVDILGKMLLGMSGMKDIATNICDCLSNQPSLHLNFTTLKAHSLGVSHRTIVFSNNQVMLVLQTLQI